LDANQEDIAFISKKFYNTIQNNNLPSGKFYDTWFKKPLLKPREHFIANGYANGWWMDLDLIKESGNYRENPDQSIDFEIILEFWPQRSFYPVVLISGVTLVICLGYLGYKKIKS